MALDPDAYRIIPLHERQRNYDRLEPEIDWLAYYRMLIVKAAEKGPGSVYCNILWRFNARLGSRRLIMARETWREYYGMLIDQAAEEGRRGGLSGIELRRFVRGQSHPGRHGIAGAWGLKMWQQEFRTRIKGLPRRKSTGVPAIPDLPGQLRMFED